MAVLIANPCSWTGPSLLGYELSFVGAYVRVCVYMCVGLLALDACNEDDAVTRGMSSKVMEI